MGKQQYITVGTV